MLIEKVTLRTELTAVMQISSPSLNSFRNGSGGLGQPFHSRDSSRVRKCIQYQKFLITCWEVAQVFDEGWKWLLWEYYQGFFLNQWKLIRGQTKNSAKIYWAPAAAEGSKNRVTVSLACSLSGAGSLHGVSVGADERWLGGYPQLWCCCMHGLWAVPCFCSGTSEGAGLVFLHLIVHNLPHCTQMQLV